MKTLKRITIMLTIISFILVAFDLVNISVLVCSWVTWIMIIFILHFLIFENEKIQGEMKLYNNHHMILYDGIVYDYKFYRNFETPVGTGDRVIGYIEDNIFVITGVVD